MTTKYVRYEARGGAGARPVLLPGYQPMRSAYLSLTLASDDEADRVYELLSDSGGQLFMSMQETFARRDVDWNGRNRDWPIA